MQARTLAREKPQYTPPDLFFQLEREYKEFARREKQNKSAQSRGAPSAARKRARTDSQISVLNDPSGDDEIDMLASDSDSEDLDDQLLRLASSGSRRKKKRKRSRKEGRPDGGKKGISLASLPPDVLKQIFAKLSLDGLHALSSVSRQFNQRLQPHVNLELWQNALDALDEVPDQSECGLTSSQIAELIYGRTCADCGGRAARWADWFLRRRLCGKCRRKSVVRLAHLDEKAGLHSAASQCVLNFKQYGYLPDLERESSKLWILEEMDQYDEAAAFSRGEAPSPPTNGAEPSRHTRRAVTGNYRWAPPRAHGEHGAQVSKYVRQRRAVLEPYESYAVSMHSAVAALYAREEAEALPLCPPARRQALERRVLDDTDYMAEDFHGAWLTHPTVNEGSSSISDEEWIKIKPKLLKLLKSVKDSTAIRDLHAQQAQRRERLREYYRKYSEDRELLAQGGLPLFVDFALLPAVRGLWEPRNADVSETTWNAALEVIEEDLNEWRIDLRMYALQQVFLATCDIPENEELAADVDEYAAWTDDFFEPVQAAFMCDIKGCYRAKCGQEEGRPTFFGSLPDLLRHQHRAHGDLELSAAAYTDPGSAPAYRFSLPLEVAHSVVAICECIGMDEATATPADIDAKLEEDPKATWQWYNVPVPTDKTGRPKGKGGPKVRKDELGWWVKEGPRERDWRKVLCHIYRETMKARRANPPYYLTIPCLTLNSTKIACDDSGVAEMAE
ncbi:hypothetical protein JCM3774_001534 [Rhodotorula dairenensis]